MEYPNYQYCDPTVVGIENEPESSKQFQVWPNPTTDFISVRSNETLSSGSIVRIVDVLGKVVYSQSVNLNEFQVPMENLPDGIYTLLITGEINQVSTHRVIKQ
ncbi:MAG: hypothetical protein ACI9UR_000419 [Bacteroidia bacterium]|jgi:hypothetical protein